MSRERKGGRTVDIGTHRWRDTRVETPPFMEWVLASRVDGELPVLMTLSFVDGWLDADLETQNAPRFWLPIPTVPKTGRP